MSISLNILLIFGAVAAAKGSVMDGKRVDFEMTDTDVGKDITIGTLMRLKELGFNVTVIIAANLRSDGTRQDIKKLIYERKSSHDMFVEHITDVHTAVPEVITEAEVERVIERGEANPLSFTDENAVVAPKELLLKIFITLDPAQDLGFIFSSKGVSGNRRKRGWWDDTKKAAEDTVVKVEELFSDLGKIWGGRK